MLSVQHFVCNVPLFLNLQYFSCNAASQLHDFLDEAFHRGCQRRCQISRRATTKEKGQSARPAPGQQCRVGLLLSRLQSRSSTGQCPLLTTTVPVEPGSCRLQSQSRPGPCLRLGTAVPVRCCAPRTGVSLSPSLDCVWLGAS